MKGIIWLYSLVIFIIGIIASTLFLNHYYATYDLISNANKRAIVETLDTIVNAEMNLSYSEVLDLYDKNLDSAVKENIRIELLAYTENPYTLRIRLINSSVPFTSITSDETVIEEEKDG